ncbi:magnesium transporter [Scopulibacillus daqui]|uniref:Magnesium transport protein CorA n=1 Tax=Scopulibacillus daqui TaxID=1469162 RepID=A0ABS2Q2Y1_9BACL|nr:magnesium transporter [Scopulibacillus daqui]
MIRTLVLTDEFEIKQNVPLEALPDLRAAWYWVDFNCPDEEEAVLLDRHFHFHPLAVEDCYHFLQRPKLDYYDDYHFFVVHALNQKTLESEEVDLFVGHNFIVTFHYAPLKEIDIVWERVLSNREIWHHGSSYVSYMIIDKLVDGYFPAVYQIEDQLNEIEDKEANRGSLMDEVFDIRSDLLKLRRTVVPMRDLLYRILNSDRLNIVKEQRAYYMDVHDHLLKLAEIIESNREITSDMRDNYLSLNSFRMNKIMITLTIISSVFIPLTFIAGVYGMNFDNMPELHWRYGYFMILGVMTLIGVLMVLWFKLKGWFDVFK